MASTDPRAAVAGNTSTLYPRSREPSSIADLEGRARARRFEIPGFHGIAISMTC